MNGVQLVTWNGYEEGTEIETGIDNCLSVSAKAAGSSVVWQVNGDEKTIDQCAVWISRDGQNLNHITDVAVGTHSADLSSAHISAGSGLKAYVQAVAKSSMINHLSAPVTL